MSSTFWWPHRLSLKALWLNFIYFLPFILSFLEILEDLHHFVGLAFTEGRLKVSGHANVKKTSISSHFKFDMFINWFSRPCWARSTRCYRIYLILSSCLLFQTELYNISFILNIGLEYLLHTFFQFPLCSLHFNSEEFLSDTRKESYTTKRVP